MIHRLLLALLGCLLAQAAPVSAHMTACRLPVLPPPAAQFCMEISDIDDSAPLTLHLDGLHDRAGLCGRVLVRQNPWSAFDPEGLFVSALITAGFAAYDTYQYATGKMSGAEYAGAMALNGAALLADVATAGAGGGLAVRAASVAIKVAKVVDKADTVYSTANGAIRTAEAIANGDGTGAVINGVLTAVGAKQMGGAGKAPDAPDVKTARTTADQSNTASDAHTIPPGGSCFVAGTLVAGDTGDRRIEDLRVGDRVLTSVTGAQDSSTMVDPQTWRLVQLRMPNPDGSRDELRFEVLRSPMWMEEVGAKPGAAIWFEFAEMGVAGLATVDAVKPCPSIAPGPGRVVLATMTHLNGFVRRLHFAGTHETLQPTATHQIYSEDRQDWVPAGELRPGETLRTQGGQARLTQIERVPGVHRVFNIEVETEHWYFVGAHRVLSHNSCAQPDLAANRGYISGSYSELRAKALAARGGDVGAMGEIEAAKLLRSEGTNVHFQTPIGPRGPNTADFLVGGQKGTGFGGAPTDVFTPITSRPGNIISGIANKNNQAPNIILNLRHTPVTGSQLGNVMDRLHNGFGATNIQNVRIIE